MPAECRVNVLWGNFTCTEITQRVYLNERKEESTYQFVCMNRHMADRGRGGKTTSGHQEMDRRGVRQVSEGSEEQRKMKETGCEIICGAPTTLAVKGQMR